MKAMNLHNVLNGDSLAEQLKATSIRKNIIVCRECLIDGTFNQIADLDFWGSRADYMMEKYQLARADYFRMTVDELKRIDEIPAGADVCLWFEDDLFCQVNMWFVLSLISSRAGLKLSRVFPNSVPGHRWKGFSACSAEMLEQSYASRVAFGTPDIALAVQLWNAYLTMDFVRLKELSNTSSPCFRYLPEVCQAHIDRFPADGSPGRPERTLGEIMETGPNDFVTVFQEFSTREGIYGFGDLQIRSLYEELLNAAGRS
ncbi:MAG TPA: DUF1835 domain-containing protein [Cyclobacteriaceae bacterium]|nr:DUF1835 domain-containing protein [Cyclobacteriaceae bacterium]